MHIQYMDRIARSVQLRMWAILPKVANIIHEEMTCVKKIKILSIILER